MGKMTDYASDTVHKKMLNVYCLLFEITSEKNGWIPLDNPQENQFVPHMRQNFPLQKNIAIF